jgi:hypothetical protein
MELKKGGTRSTVYMPDTEFPQNPLDMSLRTNVKMTSHKLVVYDMYMHLTSPFKPPSVFSNGRSRNYSELDIAVRAVCI